MKKWSFVLLVVACVTAPGVAQTVLDETHELTEGRRVDIENDFGSVEVLGWDREQVAVRGKLAKGAIELDVDREERELAIKVVIPDEWLHESDNDEAYRSELVVYVPEGLRTVDVDTLNASIKVSGVAGKLDLVTVNGTITVSDAPRELVVQTVAGPVNVSGACPDSKVSSVTGKVTLNGVTGKLEVGSVTGAIEISGKDLADVRLGSEAGNIRLDGDVLAAGSLHIRNYEGNIELVVPPTLQADIELQTFHGQIDNALGPESGKVSRFHPLQQVRFDTGSRKFDIEVATFSGNITVRTKSSAADRGAP